MTWRTARVFLIFGGARRRRIITLAIINGGLGLQLAWPYQANTKTGVLVHAVVARDVYLVWTALIAMTFIR